MKGMAIMSTVVTKLPLMKAYEEVRTLEDYLEMHFLLPEQFQALIEDFHLNMGLKRGTLMTLDQVDEYRAYLREISTRLDSF